MWAAADDTWNSKFVAKGLAELENNPNLIGVNIAPHEIPSVATVTDGYLGFEEGNAEERIASFLHAMPDSNARFYSLYRTDALKNLSYPVDHAYAWDWIVVVELLKLGRLRVLYSTEAGFNKSYGGASVSDYNVLRFLRGYVDYLRPLAYFTRSIPRSVQKKKLKKIVFLELYFILKLWMQVIKSIWRGHSRK
jgi:hypothetical protein